MIYKMFGRAKAFYRKQRFWIDQRYHHNYSFIHINKCGGTSVEKFLGIPKVHDTAAHRIKMIGKERWDNRFTFALVRHPYSKVVSHYNYRVKKNKTNLKHSFLDLNDWVKFSYGAKDPEYYDKPLMFAPCYSWLVYNGAIVVECIIKLEDIDRDWPKICENLKLYHKPLPKANRTSGNTIQAAFDQLDDEAVSIIHNHFRDDFTEFKYDKLSR